MTCYDVIVKFCTHIFTEQSVFVLMSLCNIILPPGGKLKLHLWCIYMCVCDMYLIIDNMKE